MRRAALASGSSAARLAIAVGVSAAACRSAPRTEFPVTFTAVADEPLAGVEVRLQSGKPLGTTGADGVLRVVLAAREGTKVPFRVQCPEGYRPPREMPVLTLRQLTGADPRASGPSLDVSIQCPPAERVAALVVRANQPDLPVLAEGREVARTDRDGIAHALVSLPPNSTFRVVIDTSSNARLRPQNPATTLTLPDADEIFTIDQALVEEGPGREALQPRAGPGRARRRRTRME